VTAVLAVPGDVWDGHPFVTARVLAALAYARAHRHNGHRVTDADGPHEHHWQVVGWECLGCGAIEWCDGWADE
jgi:hypothetical protein